MEKLFRKEYLPAILIYVVSAICFAVAIVLMFRKNIHWSTFVLLGIVVMTYASSVLVKIGNKLREKDEKSSDKKKDYE